MEETSFKCPENSERKMGSSLTLQEEKAQHLGKLPPGVQGAMERFERKVGRETKRQQSWLLAALFCLTPSRRQTLVQQPGSVCRCPTWEGCVGQLLPRVPWVPKGHGGGSLPPHPKLNTILCLHPLCQPVLSPTTTGGSGVFNTCIDAFQPSGDGLALLHRALG